MDRREEVFKERPKWTGFPGIGYSVGGATAATGDSVGQEPERAKLHTLSHMAGRQCAELPPLRRICARGCLSAATDLHGT